MGGHLSSRPDCFSIEQRADGNVLPRVRDGHPAGLRRVFELNMAAFLTDLDPAVRNMQRDNVLRLNRSKRGLPRRN